MGTSKMVKYSLGKKEIDHYGRKKNIEIYEDKNVMFLFLGTKIKICYICKN
jgi:hypothetical protein